MKVVCDICKLEGLMGYKGYCIDGEVKYYCPLHTSQAPIKHERRGIYDATGTPRDRDWLRNKLEMTSHEKKWHEDIKSRRLMPDGTIRRIKK